MKTYWDYKEEDRAELTQEQVTELAKYELMKAGVVTTEPPQRPVLIPVDLQQREYFTVVGIKEKRSYYDQKETLGTFETLEGAQAVLSANPLSVTKYSLESGCDVAGTYQEIKIERTMCTPAHLFANIRADVEKNSEATKAYESLQLEYEKQVQKSNEATQAMWADYYSLQRDKHKREQIKRTFEEYKALCDGKAETAFTFLLKAYPGENLDFCDPRPQLMDMPA